MRFTQNIKPNLTIENVQTGVEAIQEVWCLLT